MIARLFLKEFKESSFLAKKGMKKIFTLLSSLVLLTLFITLEVLLYINIFDKVNVYTDFNDALFIIIEFALFIVGIFSLVPITYNAFFKNQKESETDNHVNGSYQRTERPSLQLYPDHPPSGYRNLFHF